MTAPTNTSQVTETKPTDKELNFRQLEAKYERQLQQERSARLEAERIAKETQEAQKRNDTESEESDSEPYVDQKKLAKTLNKFGQSTQDNIQKSMQAAKEAAKEELRQEMWLENNPDFYDILQHAEKLAQKSPALTKSILAMPDNFERQKLVYQNIKEFGLHKTPERQPSVQDKIDANRKSPFYQPTNVGAAPYSGAQSDFSQSGQKEAYNKMQELKNRLRLG